MRELGREADNRRDHAVAAKEAMLVAFSLAGEMAVSPLDICPLGDEAEGGSGEPPEEPPEEPPGEEIEVEENPEAGGEIAKDTRVRWAPPKPTEKELDEHEARAHIPSRSWCPHCVMGRSISSQHRTQVHDQQEKEERLPTMHLDYYFQGNREEDVLPMLAIKFKPTRTVVSSAVEAKGVTEHAVKVIVEAVRKSGHRRLLIKSDNESALVAVVTSH